jgi:hypothetical protein
MWPIGGAEDRTAEILVQMDETTRIHQQAIAMNQQLLLSGVRPFKLRDPVVQAHGSLSSCPLGRLSSHRFATVQANRR